MHPPFRHPVFGRIKMLWDCCLLHQGKKMISLKLCLSKIVSNIKLGLKHMNNLIFIIIHVKMLSFLDFCYFSRDVYWKAWCKLKTFCKDNFFNGPPSENQGYAWLEHLRTELGFKASTIHRELRYVNLFLDKHNFFIYSLLKDKFALDNHIKIC